MGGVETNLNAACLPPSQMPYLFAAGQAPHPQGLIFEHDKASIADQIAPLKAKQKTPVFSGAVVPGDERYPE